MKRSTQIVMGLLFSIPASAVVPCEDVHPETHVYKDCNHGKYVRFAPVPGRPRTFLMETLEYDSSRDALVMRHGFFPKPHLNYAKAELISWGGTCTIRWTQADIDDTEFDRIMSYENGGDLDLWGDHETRGTCYMERKLNNVSDTAVLDQMRIDFERTVRSPAPAPSRQRASVGR